MSMDSLDRALTLSGNPNLTVILYKVRVPIDCQKKGTEPCDSEKVASNAQTVKLAAVMSFMPHVGNLPPPVTVV
jgi:hypothetical protein